MATQGETLVLSTDTISPNVSIMTKTLQDSEHLHSLVKSLDESRTQGKFCDIKIAVGNRTFTAHKAVLASSSQYFAGMFNSCWRENDSSEINIEGDPKIFELLLEFIYRGRLSITEETIVDILALSVYMQVMGAMKLCTEYLRFCYLTESVNIVIASDILRQVQDNNQLLDLTEATVNYIAHNLVEFYQEEKEDFLECVTTEILSAVLKDQDVEANATETQILEVILDWLNHDWEHRKHHSNLLLRDVRLGLVPGSELRRLTKDSPIQDMTDCIPMVTKVLEQQEIHRDNLAGLISIKPTMFATRNTITALIIVGGNDSAIRYFDEESSEWKVAPIPSVPVIPANQLRNPASLVVDGILYVAGGGACRPNGDHEFKYTFHQYNAATLEWTSLPNMTVARERCHLVYMDRCIYAIGGVNHSSHHFLNCVERFNFRKDQWESIAPLPSKFCHISAVVYQGQLLIYGAPEYRASPGRVRHTLLYYHVSMNRWEVLLTGMHYLSAGWPKTALVVEGDKCYRVIYEAYMMRNPLPQVQQLQFQKQKGTKELKVLIGDTERQNLIPKLDNKGGVFRIKEDIFVNITLENASYCHKTDIKISVGQTSDVDLDLLTDVSGLRHDGNWLKAKAIMSGSVNKFTFHNHVAHHT